MPITGTGWEMCITRKSEQRRASDGKRRTVGDYQIYHDGQKQTGAGLSGMVAETRGPGDNTHENNNRRVEAGRYPLATQDGVKYVTIGYKKFGQYFYATQARDRTEGDRSADGNFNSSGDRLSRQYRLHQSLHIATQRR